MVMGASPFAADLPDGLLLQPAAASTVTAPMATAARRRAGTRDENNAVSLSD